MQNRQSIDSHENGQDHRTGSGPSVRGEKDYSAVVILADLIRLLRIKRRAKKLSSEMDTQIEIGLVIAEYAKDTLRRGEIPDKAFSGLIRQCLQRDSAVWKTFYAQEMEGVKPTGPNKRVLDIYATKPIAEQKYRSGDKAGATACIQTALDKKVFDPEDKAWYIQEMARYSYCHAIA